MSSIGEPRESRCRPRKPAVERVPFERHIAISRGTDLLPDVS